MLAEQAIGQLLAWGIFLFLLQIIFLLLIRPIILWYFKVSEMITIQNKTLHELQKIRIEAQEQTRLLRQKQSDTPGDESYIEFKAEI